MTDVHGQPPSGRLGIGVSKPQRASPEVFPPRAGGRTAWRARAKGTRPRNLDPLCIRKAAEERGVSQVWRSLRSLRRGAGRDADTPARNAAGPRTRPPPHAPPSCWEGAWARPPNPGPTCRCLRAQGGRGRPLHLCPPPKPWGRLPTRTLSPRGLPPASPDRRHARGSGARGSSPGPAAPPPPFPASPGLPKLRLLAGPSKAPVPRISIFPDAARSGLPLPPRRGLHKTAATGILTPPVQERRAAVSCPFKSGGPLGACWRKPRERSAGKRPAEIRSGSRPWRRITPSRSGWPGDPPLLCWVTFPSGARSGSELQ